MTRSHKPTVYIVQTSPGKNTLPLLSWGDCQTIFPARYQVIFDQEHAVQQARIALKDIGPDDYIVALGDPAAIAIVAALVALKLGAVRMLKWDRQECIYYEVHMNLKEDAHETSTDQ